jgi:enoyl-CoA hydratase/carnithine racemase
MPRESMIDVKTEDGIAIVTIRHGKANALDIALCEGLAKCFEELRAADARAVVLTGQGRRRRFAAGDRGRRRLSAQVPADSAPSL